MQDFHGLLVVRILYDARHRADLDALRRVVMTDTLGSQFAINLIDFFAQVNSTVRAFRLAHVAIDAFLRNQQGHDLLKFIVRLHTRTLLHRRERLRLLTLYTLGDFLTQRVRDVGGDKLRDITAEGGDLLHQRRGDEGVTLRRR